MSVQLDTDTVDFDQQVAAWLSQYRQLRAEIAQLQERADIARQHIEAALGDCSVGCVDGVPAVRWTTVESERFDVKTARAVLPAETVESLLKRTTSRRFTLVDADGGAS